MTSATHQQQIIALGGGGFLMEPDNPALDRYVLEQSGSTRPAICFVATATGDADQAILAFYTAFSRLDCRPSHLPLFHRTPAVEQVLLDQDVIYVGGGNTKSMLAVWREWGLPDLLARAWRKGIVLAGVSAGAVCWFEQGVTDSCADRLRVLPGLGLLPGSCCPHYDGESERRPSYRGFVADGEISAGWAIDDGVAVHFIGHEVVAVVASREGAAAYRVASVADGVQEDRLKPQLL